MKKALTLLLLFVTLTTFSQFQEIIEIEEEEEINENNPIPFSIIEEVPVFPGCESLDRRGQKDCLNKKLQRHIAKNFNLDLIECLETTLVLNEETGRKEKKCISTLSGKQRIYLQFKIGLTGDIEDINVRALHPKLKQEAIRVAKLIPKMKPGIQRGKPVRVAYTLPIVFNVE